MIGSILISERDTNRIKQFQVDAMPDYHCVALDALNTLDFQTIADSGNISWSESEPVIYNEDEGVALFKLKPEGLTYFLENANKLSKGQLKDKSEIEVFLNKHGCENIYEYATF